MTNREKETPWHFELSYSISFTKHLTHYWGKSDIYPSATCHHLVNYGANTQLLLFYMTSPCKRNITDLKWNHFHTLAALVCYLQKIFHDLGIKPNYWLWNVIVKCQNIHVSQIVSLSCLNTAIFKVFIRKCRFTHFVNLPIILMRYTLCILQYIWTNNTSCALGHCYGRFGVWLLFLPHRKQRWCYKTSSQLHRSFLFLSFKPHEVKIFPPHSLYLLSGSLGEKYFLFHVHFIRETLLMKM